MTADDLSPGHDADEYTELVPPFHAPGDAIVSLAERVDAGLRTFELVWSDGVANTWLERYADPAVAFARLAALLRAVERERYFRHRQSVDDEAADWRGPAAFVADAHLFLNDQLERS